MTHEPPPENIFWDSCVFFRFLTENPKELVDDIARYITDARDGRRKIYFSTIAYAEISQKALSKKRYKSIEDFFNSWSRTFIPIDPNPNILIKAGQLRDTESVNPSDPKIKEERKRVIGIPDAIHLTTCLYLRDVLGISDIVFHTFDAGRGKTSGGRCVPLIGFGRWYPEDQRTPHIKKVCELPIEKPVYPDPDLVTKSNYE